MQGHTGGGDITKPLLFDPRVATVIRVAVLSVAQREGTEGRRGSRGAESVGACNQFKPRSHCIVPADRFQAFSCFHSVCACVGTCTQSTTALSFSRQVCDGPTPCRPPDLLLLPCRAQHRLSPGSQVPAAHPPRLSLSWDPAASHPCLQSPPGFLQSHSHYQTLSSAKTL